MAVSSEENSDADDRWAGNQRSSRYLKTSSSLARPADDLGVDTVPSWSGQVSHGDDVPAVVGYSGFSAEADLAAQVAALQEHLQAALVNNNQWEKHLFSAERILEGPSLLQFYTDLQWKAMLMSCLNYLQRSALSTKTWRGEKSNLDGNRTVTKTGPQANSALCCNPLNFL